MKHFIEIGSSFFNTLHPLLEQGYSGIMIEPIKKFFDKIEDNPNLISINTAITSHGRPVEFKVPTDEFIERSNDRDYCGMSSIRPEKNGIISWSFDMYEKVTVDSITFDKLMNDYVFFHFGENIIIDLLKIDVEGYDLELLESIDFDKYNIKRIIIEYKHCGYEETIKILESKGYVSNLCDVENIYARKKE